MVKKFARDRKIKNLIISLADQILTGDGPRDGSREDKKVR